MVKMMMMMNRGIIPIIRQEWREEEEEEERGERERERERAKRYTYRYSLTS